LTLGLGEVYCAQDEINLPPHKADEVDGEEREEAPVDLVSGPPQKPWQTLAPDTT